MKIHLHDMETGIICGEDGLAIADCNVAPRIEKKVKANAAFIVRAVNAHEKLLKSVKSMLLYIETYGGDVTSNFVAGGNGKFYHDLIAKVEGKGL